ncbi:MAG TPA: cytochrome c biogenesis protein DipZ [Frankiaceae bacterium]|nr:cytochrome c biogenesis protein DipZ [Frankiaceae bacterium]
MITLVVVGLLGGLITSLSPCILPVLPIVLAAGMTSSGASQSEAQAAPVRYRTRVRRPLLVVAGLVVSFSLATLFGSLVLSSLDLPQDTLRDAGIAVLLLVGLGLLVPKLGELLERPFIRLQKRAIRPGSQGLGLGLALGLVFVPCAGPVLAAIAVVGATHRVGVGAFVLTLAFAVGIAIPLLAFALAGEQAGRRIGVFRRRMREVRLGGGILMIAVALAIAFNLTDGLQRLVPGYTSTLQNKIESNASASKQLHKLTQSTKGVPMMLTTCQEGASNLRNCGPAPDFAGISTWLNTPDGKALSLASLKGHVVLLDFWTYSCINCQRTLPHVEAWYKAYQAAGFEVVGVHTPEFAFEHVTSNIKAAASSLGVKYPIAVDNGYDTWNAYNNQYWPAEYLIDANGNIRHIVFGEGDYSSTEKLIRQLLTAAHPSTSLAKDTGVADMTPTEPQTPESYIGYEESQNAAQSLVQNETVNYQPPATVAPDTFALSGLWKDSSQFATAGTGAKLAINYQGKAIYLVLGGQGDVTVNVGGQTRTIKVSGVPRLYTLNQTAKSERHVLTLAATPGIQAYDFTFG